jgi:hypothetical protein
LITRSTTLEDEIERFKAETARIKAATLNWNKLGDEIAAKHEEAKAENAALKAALAAYSTRPPTPPPSIFDISPELIFQAIELSVTDAIRSKVQPIVSELYEDVENMLKMQNAEMYKELWGKLSLTLQTVEAISAAVSNQAKGEET